MKRCPQGRYNGAYMHYTYTYLHKGFYSLATLPRLSPEARKRLKWFDYYRKCQNAAQTCRYFGISRKTFYLWKKRYQPYHLESLEEQSRRPKRTRHWEVSRNQEFRILSLRRQYLRYGKEKLKVIYERQYNEPVSSWRIQRVIEKHHLYYHPAKTLKLKLKRRRNQPKKRITELKKELRQGFLIQLDTIVVFWNGLKRYILTGIDHYSKISFARMYSSHHSKYAADFLKRLYYLFDHKIENIQTDNGSEFAKEFQKAQLELGLAHYFSRPKTPQDNAFDERFNRTLKDEFISMGNLTADCDVFNRKLTDWLIEYNFHRPHQALDYETPVEFHYKYHKVLPMYPSSTTA